MARMQTPDYLVTAEPEEDGYYHVLHRSQIIARCTSHEYAMQIAQSMDAPSLLAADALANATLVLHQAMEISDPAGIQALTNVALAYVAIERARIRA